MRVALATLNVLLMVGYPFAVYWGLTRYGARGVGVVILLALVPSLVSKLAAASREDLLAVLKMPLAIGLLVGLGAWLDDPRFAKALPVLINVSLLWSFGTSLASTPMVERFARMQEDSLSDAQVSYCRSVTKVWSGFFAFNAAITAALAFWAPTRWWMIYTGGIAYGLIGTLASTEYIVRKARFREYGDGLHDRMLARLFPPRTEGGEA